MSEITDAEVMILAAAGLLQGYKATCHWVFRDQTAGEEIVTGLLQPGQPMIEAFLAQTKETAMRLNKVP